MPIRMNSPRGVVSTGLVVASLCLVLFVLSACDSMLNKQPKSFISPENFYQNESDARTALNGAYNGLRWMEWKDAPLVLMFPTTSATTTAPPSSSVGSFDVWSWTPSNSSIFEMWAQIYEAINRANAVINRVPSIEMDQQLRSRLVAEARFLRAYNYFTLTRLFGGVPLRTSETTSLDSLEVSAASADKMYSFLISDLQKAMENLPPVSMYSGTDKARASKGAAKTLLAKVYLHRGGGGTVTASSQPDDFQNAARLLKEVMDSGEYQLSSEYTSLFAWETGTNERNSEVIFALEHMRREGQGQYGFHKFVPKGSDFGFAQGGRFYGELYFLQSYSENDPRREAAWLTEYVDADGNRHVFDADDVENDGFVWDGPAFRKLMYETNNMGNAKGPRDFILLRYGEVLLMYAEALNEMNNGPTPAAYDAVNKVRNRVGLPDLASGLSYEQFKDTLFDERRWELVQEFKGWYTCQRFWKRCKAAVEASADNADLPYDRYPSVDFELQAPRHRLFPVPQRALDRNPNLEQNEGYAGG